jgi:hypothetical protein
MLRKFKIGQLVKYRSSAQQDAPGGVYRIISFLPLRERNGEPEYLVKNLNEGYERVVRESQLLRLQRSQPNEGAPPKRG